MSENYYEPPVYESVVPDDSKRPLGVVLIAALTSLLAILMLVGVVLIFVQWDQLAPRMLRPGMAPAMLWCLFGVMPILIGMAAAGMWRRAKWGWYLACFVWLLFSLSESINAVRVNVSPGGPSLSRFTSNDSLKHLLRAAIATGVLVYWLRRRVMRHFGLGETNRLKALLLVALVGFGLMCLVLGVLQLEYLIRTDGGRRAAGGNGVDRVERPCVALGAAVARPVPMQLADSDCAAEQRPWTITHALPALPVRRNADHHPAG